MHTSPLGVYLHYSQNANIWYLHIENCRSAPALWAARHYFLNANIRNLHF